MTNDKRINVYLSSTSLDLKEFRQAAIRAIHDLGYHAVGMENYGAVDETAVEKCLADVRACQVYVGIIAWRYGFIPNGFHQSITELEYCEAHSQRIPTLVFLLDQDSSWPVCHIDNPRDRIDRFRSTVMHERVISFFNSPDNLASELKSSLVKCTSAMNTSPTSSPPLRLPHLDRESTHSPIDALCYFRRNIDLIGRQKELQLLESFLGTIEDGPTFKWWLWTGPAGVGKSRLALEFCLKKRDSWHVGFLPRTANYSSWSNWKPQHPTLIVVDYLAGRASEIGGAIAEMAATQLEQPVRFLLLERNVNATWFDRLMRVDSRSEHDSIISSRFDAPRELAGLEESAIHQALIAELHVRGCSATADVPQFVARIQRMDPMGRPLFVALAADALIGNRSADDWKERSLIDRVIDREVARWKDRLPDEELRQRYVNLVILATLIGGLTLTANPTIPTLFDDATLASLIPKEEAFKAHVYSELSQVRETGDGCELTAFQPDILGECLILRMLESDLVTRRQLIKLLHAAWSFDPGHTGDTLERINRDFPCQAALDAFKSLPRCTEDQRLNWALNATYRIAEASSDDAFWLYEQVTQLCGASKDDNEHQLGVTVNGCSSQQHLNRYRIASAFALAEALATGPRSEEGWSHYCRAGNSLSTFLAFGHTDFIPPAFYCDAAVAHALNAARKNDFEKARAVARAFRDLTIAVRFDPTVFGNRARLTFELLRLALNARHRDFDLFFKDCISFFESYAYEPHMAEAFAEATHAYVYYCCENDLAEKGKVAFDRLVRLNIATHYRTAVRVWLIESARRLLHSPLDPELSAWVLSDVLQPFPRDSDDSATVRAFGQLLADFAGRGEQLTGDVPVFYQFFNQLVRDCPSHLEELKPLRALAALNVLGGQGKIEIAVSRQLYQVICDVAPDERNSLRALAKMVYGQRLCVAGEPQEGIQLLSEAKALFQDQQEGQLEEWAADFLTSLKERDQLAIRKGDPRKRRAKKRK